MSASRASWWRYGAPGETPARLATARSDRAVAPFSSSNSIAARRHAARKSREPALGRPAPVTPRRRGPRGFRATGLARTAYRRRMLTCSPARRFRCSARDDVDGRGGYPSNSVAVTTRSPRRASRGWTRMRRVGVQPARSSGCPRVRAAALRGAGAGGWLAQHVDRPVAPLGADG
jgi:hypothetical protein